MKINLDLPSYVSSKKLDDYFRGGGAPFAGRDDEPEDSASHEEEVRSSPPVGADLQDSGRAARPQHADPTGVSDSMPEQRDAIPIQSEGQEAEVGEDRSGLRKRRRVSGPEDETVPEAPITSEPTAPADGPVGSGDPPVAALAGLLGMHEEDISVGDERGVLRWFRRARMTPEEPMREGLHPAIEGLIRDAALSTAKAVAYSNRLVDGMLAELAKDRQLGGSSRRGDREEVQALTSKLEQALGELATERGRSALLEGQLCEKTSDWEKAVADHQALLEGFDASQGRIAQLERINSELERGLRETESRLLVAKDLGAIEERKRLIAICQPRFDKLAAYIRGRDAAHTDLMLMSQAKGCHEAYLGLTKELPIPQRLIDQVSSDFAVYRDKVAAVEVPEVGPADLLFSADGDGVGCSNASVLPS